MMVFDLIPHSRNEEFIVVEVDVKNNQAIIRTQDGNNNYLLKREIPYTDLAEDKWKFYVEDATTYALYLHQRDNMPALKVA
jgi:hypothetical protein